MHDDPGPFPQPEDESAATSRGDRRGQAAHAAGNRDRRKTLQLCRQIAHALEFALSDCNDDLLRDLRVQGVTPLGGVGQLLVTVVPVLPDANWDLRQSQSRLDQFAGRLRCQVAQSIHRRRAPKLIFQVAV